LQAHVLAHFIREKEREAKVPSFPFLCLLVSGGHTQLIVVRSHNEMEAIGNTVDDAAGEAFDKCGKVMGFPYPAGPLIDNLARDGNRESFRFAKPSVKGLDFSFSGLKTNFLYFLRDKVAEEADFINRNKADLCASLQHTIVSILVGKLTKAAEKTGITEIAIAGGVSANSGLRQDVTAEAEKRGWNLYIPAVAYTTDNAAMIGITGYYKYLNGEFAGHDIAPLARFGV
jgi:N6-L-threonylcarbamoyladenine synthase